MKFLKITSLGPGWKFFSLCGGNLSTS